MKKLSELNLQNKSLPRRKFLKFAAIISSTFFSSWNFLQIFFPSKARAGGFVPFAFVKSKLVAKDPYFKNTVLLLSGEGLNLAQNNTFLDSSSNNFTITRTGNVSQGSHSPLGGNWSVGFNGSTDYITTSVGSNINGTGDYTIEFWVYIQGTLSTTDSTSFFDSRPANNTAGVFIGIIYNTSAYISVAENASAYITSNTAYAKNTWTHIAVVRSGTSVTLYQNGVSVGTATNSSNHTCATYFIGKGYWSGAPILNGFISNFRILKGTALYSSSFTPSKSPLTAISNTVLLFCHTSRFCDGSSNNTTLTLNGPPQIHKFSPFTEVYSPTVNGGSAYFDGSGDYLTISDNANLRLGSSDFTIEAWVNYMTVQQCPIVAKWANTNGEFYFGTLGTSFSLLLSANGNTSSGYTTLSTTGFTIVANTWNHFAITRQGTTLSIYVNGVLNNTGTFSGSLFNGVNSVIMGQNPDNGQSFNGSVSSLRIVKGSALYTSNFTPSKIPLTAVTNTQLLCNFTNAGIYDSTGAHNIETLASAQISTNVKKFGSSSIYLNGTSYFQIVKASNLFNFGTENFTIECWFYHSAVSPGNFTTFLDQWYNNADPYFTVQFQGTGGTTPSFYLGGRSSFIAASAVTTSTWHHMAFVRNGTTISLYVDGVSVASVTSFTGNVGSGTDKLTIGAQSNSLSITGWMFIGYLDDIRITKGVARYTSNFTPPTEAFPTS